MKMIFTQKKARELKLKGYWNDDYMIEEVPIRNNPLICQKCKKEIKFSDMYKFISYERPRHSECR